MYMFIYDAGLAAQSPAGGPGLMSGHRLAICSSYLALFCRLASWSCKPGLRGQSPGSPTLVQDITSRPALIGLHFVCVAPCAVQIQVDACRWIELSALS